MADLCTVYTFGALTLNPSSGDGLFIGEGGIQGLDGRPIRAQVDNKGVTDGGIVHPKFFGPRAIRFGGPMKIESVARKPTVGFFAAVNAVEAATIAALEALLNTPTALSWTPFGGTPESLTCTYGIEGGEIQFGGSMMLKTWTFALVAESG
jgi:hypothetical protein